MASLVFVHVDGTYLARTRA